MKELEAEIVRAVLETVVEAVERALKTGRAADALDAAKSRACFEAHRIAWLHAADAIARSTPAPR